MPVGAGTLLGRYRLQRPAGRGGMSEVWQAEDTTLHRSVAVKVILDPVAQDPSFSERFLREARLVAGLQHPNILPVFDFGTSDVDGRQVSFLVMPLVEGGSLKERITGPVPFPTAVAWLSAVARALDHSHARGILHRDVKPGNVLVDSSGTPLLADFGLARSASSSSGLTTTGAVLGTPLYMAPEQAEGKPLDARADQYALGIIAFEMLTGKVPFHADSPLAVLHQHVSTPPEAVSKVRDGIPPGTDDVLGRALAKNPSSRFPSCGAFVSALAAALGVSRDPDSLAGLAASTDPGSMETFVSGPGTPPSAPPGAPPIAPSAPPAGEASPPVDSAPPGRRTPPPLPLAAPASAAPAGERNRTLLQSAVAVAALALIGVAGYTLFVAKGRTAPPGARQATTALPGPAPAPSATPAPAAQPVPAPAGLSAGSLPTAVPAAEPSVSRDRGPRPPEAVASVPRGAGAGPRPPSAGDAGGPLESPGSRGAAGPREPLLGYPPALSRPELAGAWTALDSTRKPHGRLERTDFVDALGEARRALQRAPGAETDFLVAFSRAGVAFADGGDADAWQLLRKAFSDVPRGAFSGRRILFAREMVETRGNLPGDDRGWILGLAFADVRGDLREELTKAFRRAPRSGAVAYASALEDFDAGRWQEARRDARRACDYGLREGCSLFPGLR